MNTTRISSFLARGAALVALAIAGSAAALAQQQQPQQVQTAEADPPARVATVTALEGSVAFAPAGETDWAELPRNRPITRGDRLWTDEGGRAELHLGSSVLHMDSRTFVEVIAIDDDVVQLSVNQGSVNARARELRAGDNFEIATPQLALRATQPGDWRIDVDPQNGLTRVTSHSGVAVAYGAGGNVQQIAAGQQVAFAGRDLAQIANPPAADNNAFERWASDRNRAEDQSVAARFIPRDVVGYAELDNHGTWSEDANYGTVWYPQVTVADWAPYRYGHWDYISPWGWTWVDDAAWGFAPFHYGRWTTIGSRWAWVPGPLGRHPVYSPALVAFVGNSGPSIGWYPLAPGEIWRPFFNASPVYVRNVNRYVVTDSRRFNNGPHYFMRRPDAVTTVRVDDFNRGRAVQSRWTRWGGNDLARVQNVMPPTPTREARREFFRDRRVVTAPPAAQQQNFVQRQRVDTPRAQFFQPREQVREQVREQREVQHQQAREQQQFQREQQARAQQAREMQVRQQQQWRDQQQQAVQRQQHEAVQRQQQAVREAQRQQAWQHQQQQQQRAYVQQQPQQRHEVQQQARPVQQQRREDRQDRREQRQAQREDDNNRGHRRW